MEFFHSNLRTFYFRICKSKQDLGKTGHPLFNHGQVSPIISKNFDYHASRNYYISNKKQVSISASVTITEKVKLVSVTQYSTSLQLITDAVTDPRPPQRKKGGGPESLQGKLFETPFVVPKPQENLFDSQALPPPQVPSLTLISLLRRLLSDKVQDRGARDGTHLLRGTRGQNRQFRLRALPEHRHRYRADIQELWVSGLREGLLGKKLRTTCLYLIINYGINIAL